MVFYDSKPFSRQVLHTKLTSFDDTSFCKIKTKDSRLFYIISGDGEFVLEGISYPIKPDTIILFKAGTEYEWKIKEVEFFVINFDYTQEFSNIKRTFHPFSSSAFDSKSAFDCGFIEDYPELNKPIVVNNASSLKRQIIDISTESALTDDYSGFIISNLMTRIILEILRIHQGNTLSIPDNTSNVKQIIEYIYANYQKKISNKEIAEYFNYNPSYISRVFKQHTGQTLHNFILEFRLEIAKELLTNKNTPIGEICKQIGFTDFYHFSKTFKQKTGKTPSEYRSHHIK